MNVRNCENCQSENDGSYGSGRFCCENCARSFSSMLKREEVNKKVSETMKKKSLRGELNKGKPFQKGYDVRRNNIPQMKGLYKHSDESKKRITESLYKWHGEKLKKKLETTPFEKLSKRLRRRILIKERGDKCECCGLGEWLGTKLVVQIDHDNGNHNDNQKENLRLLCPNCHSLTPTWKGKNITKRVSKEEFKEALKTKVNIHQALKFLGLNPGGGNYNTAKKLVASGGFEPATV